MTQKSLLADNIPLLEEYDMWVINFVVRPAGLARRFFSSCQEKAAAAGQLDKT